MKIERSPTQMVKPNKATSGEPIVPLSSSDLFVFRVHVQCLYAFKAPAPQNHILKQGLSETLSHYPHLAGRTSATTSESGRPAIVLNDAGAALVEAEADGPLYDLWPFKPSHHLLVDLIPPHKRGDPELFHVQLTRFTCGGMTIGVALDHIVADGEATTEFINAWGSIVRGLPILVPPVHDRSLLMPRDPPQPTFDHTEYIKPPSKSLNGNYPDLAMNKLHFNTDLLKKIKAEALKGASEGTIYSTFVSLLAHLWRCITKARGLENEEDESRVWVSVSVRKRINPTLPKGYFGNAIYKTCSHAPMKKLVNKPLSFAASLIHDSINMITNDRVRSAYDLVEIERKKPPQIAKTNGPTLFAPNLMVTSWLKLPLYELDFGTGTPIFAGCPFVPCEGLLAFLPSPKTDGSIDVALGLCVPHMEKLESICFDI